MSSDDRLDALFAAERAEQPSPQTTAHGLETLRSALGANLAAPAVAHGPLKLGVSLFAKWTVGSAVLVVGALSATIGVRPAAPPASRSTATVTPSAALSSPRVAPPPEATAIASAENTPLARPATVSPTSASADAAEPSSTFRDELRLIKAAKQDLDAGRDRGAVELLRDHARLYPGGIFASERDALLVLLDCRIDPTRGQASARRFLQSNASSPLVDRITRACALGTPATPAVGSFPESTPIK